MSQEQPKGLDLIKYWWYRALGHSDTQARWQLRDKQKLQSSQNLASRHKHCESCRQLMLIEEKACSNCGYKSYMPAWSIRLVKSMQIQAELVLPLLVALCLFGYLVQIKLGADFFGGLSSDTQAQRRILIMGGVLPLPFSEYISSQHAWRLFTYTCLHGNLMHIAFNLIALVQIGPLVARTFGFSRTLFIWVFSGMSAILLPALFMDIPLTIGASGSVFGLIGVAMAYGHRIGTAQGKFIRNKMIEWTVFCTLFGFMLGGVAHSAHFGGLIGGAALSFVLAPPQTSQAQARSIFFFIVPLLFILWSFWSAWEVFELVSIY